MNLAELGLPVDGSLIPNCDGNIRYVCLDKNYFVTVVDCIKDDTSYQLMERAVRYVIKSEKQAITDNAIVGVVSLKPLGPLSHEISQEFIEELPKEIYDFLFWKTESKILPAGFGWDGKRTWSEISFIAKVKQFLIGDYKWEGLSEEILTVIAEAALEEKDKSTICLNWDQVERIVGHGEMTFTTSHMDMDIVIAQNDKLSKRLEVVSRMATMTNEFDRYIVIQLPNELKGNKFKLELYKRG